ncbi:MAG TPA: hypothetical protein VJK30_00310 [Coxiellaceae bacterium]|nr:MAG: hypothetical protein A3E81_08420 [Gammaproteobacteria bacterium RIFCSPHIGHO2_12_FULL_36_30]HLB55759.1 hypothetical protein [Coxiellaceae bacterium]
MPLIKLIKKTQRGAAILEILIGFIISLVILAAVLGLFSNTISTSGLILERGKLDRDLYVVMDTIVNDIQRAGYWSNATTTNNNPFMTSPNDIAISSGCIKFTYDTNNNGTVDDADQIGYGLSNGAIKFRQSAAIFNCSSIATWSNLTDPNVITVTAFTVMPINYPVDIDGSNPGTATTTYRTVYISITANLVTDPSNTRTITRTIKIYNNKYSP